MFICKVCKKKLNLTKQGKEWVWPDSEGPCESCDIVTICEDISCQYDWAWNDKIDSNVNIKHIFNDNIDHIKKNKNSYE